MFRACCTGFLLAVLLPAMASAATYRGRSIDGHRFNAKIMNEDFGAVTGEVKFSGLDATVYLRGGQLHLTLDDEDITDPRHIRAHDNRRGTDWEIDVRNLREAIEGKR